MMPVPGLLACGSQDKPWMPLLLCPRWRAASQHAVELCPQVFSKVGDVKRIVMGLDKQQLTPCGFCFVVYYTRPDTEDCVKCARLLSKLPPSPLFSFPFITHHTSADTEDCMMCGADRFPVSLVLGLGLGLGFLAHCCPPVLTGVCVAGVFQETALLLSFEGSEG